jgi:hypothetical protein
MSKTPYLKYYLVTFISSGKSLLELYEDELAKALNYYAHFGQDGFLSERMRQDDIVPTAERNALRRLDKDLSATSSVERVAIDPKTEAEQIEKIENTDGFIKWIS